MQERGLGRKAKNVVRPSLGVWRILICIEEHGAGVGHKGRDEMYARDGSRNRPRSGDL